MSQARLARQSNRVVRRWPRAQRAIGRLHARLNWITGDRFLPRWFAGAPVMVLETGSGEVLVGRHRMRVRPGCAPARSANVFGWRSEMYPQAEHYTRFTDRAQPLIALERAGT